MTDLLKQVRSLMAGRFDVEREIGAGGMATVFLARDIAHGRPVAVKVLAPEISASLAKTRFLREIEIVGGLQHPNIVPLYDSGVVGDVLYFVMPYVEGHSLRDRLEREVQLPVEEAIRIFREVGGALSYAHGRGIVHRDVKPANILLSSGRPMVADFGIALAADYAATPPVTRTGVSVGSPQYMSPEQANESHVVDERADVYSLGCVLYEMLAGEPPYDGPTPQVILAKALTGRARPLRVVRNTVPEALDRAVLRSLAAVPADRFATVEDFMSALDAPGTRGGSDVPAWAWDGETRPGRRRLSKTSLAVIAAGLAAAGLGTVSVLLFGSFSDLGRSPLDPARIMVFPPRSVGASGLPEGTGQEIATVVGYALEGSRPLRWLEGVEWLTPAERLGSALVPLERKARISREQRARYFVDGTVLQQDDSITVVLRLYDVAGDSLVQRAGATEPGPTASLGHLGLRAIRFLLPTLLEPGREVDLTALESRSPAAIANWLQGERAYRAADFSTALQHFRTAVEQDDQLALAALGAAQAASWTSRLDEAEAMVDVALEREELLPERHAAFARGYRAYLDGRADRAVDELRRALALDGDWPEAWAVLGAVYANLLHPAFDSAELAYREAARADPDFTPALGVLAEYAMRRGDVDRAASLLERFGSFEPDSVSELRLRLMLRCVREGPEAVAWDEAARSHPLQVLLTGTMLSAGGAQLPCARAAFQATLVSDSARSNEVWGSVLSLHSLLMSTGDYEAIPDVLERQPRRPYLFLLAAAAGGPFAGQAEALRTEIEAELEADPASVSSPVLWLYGLWVARQGRAAEAARAAGVARGRAEAGESRRERLIADILAAWSHLAAADTADAAAGFAALRPSARRDDLQWQPWESLGAETLELSRIRVRAGRLEDAYASARLLDHPQPVIYLAYLRPSLEVRLQAARTLGWSDSVAVLERRLDALAPPTTSASAGAGIL